MTGSSQSNQPSSAHLFAAVHTAMRPNRAHICQQLVTRQMMVQINQIDEILDSNRMIEECLEDVPEEQLKTSLKHALQKIIENKLGEMLFNECNQHTYILHFTLQCFCGNNIY